MCHDIPGFVKTGSGIQKLKGGIHRQHGDRISMRSFFQNWESRLKIIISSNLMKVIISFKDTGSMAFIQNVFSLNTFVSAS
jgi:hypothetical protein